MALTELSIKVFFASTILIKLKKDEYSWREQVPKEDKYLEVRTWNVELKFLQNIFHSVKAKTNTATQSWNFCKFDSVRTKTNNTKQNFI